MKLISEETFDDIGTRMVINEDTGEKQWFIEGIFAQAEKKNRNKRTYPLKVLEREINRYDRDYVKTKRALGELNHPEYPKPNPAEASHRVIELTKESNDFYGKAIVMNTPKGNILKGLLEADTQMGVSTRGAGTIKESVVQDDYVMFCFDSVSDPSAIDAWVNGILEGREWVWQENKLVEVAADTALHDIKKMKRVNEEKLIKAFNKFIKSI